MKVHINENDGYTDYIDVRFSPSEFLLFYATLKQTFDNSDDVDETAMIGAMIDSLEEELKDIIKGDRQ